MLVVAYAARNPDEAAKLYRRYAEAIERLRDGKPATAERPEGTTARVLRDPYLSGLVTRVAKQREDKRRAKRLQDEKERQRERGR